MQAMSPLLGQQLQKLVQHTGRGAPDMMFLICVRWDQNLLALVLVHTNSEYEFHVNNHEVARVVQVPLAHLMDDRNMELEVRQHKGKQVLVPAYTYEGHRIWGATARMLRELLELLT